MTSERKASCQCGRLGVFVPEEPDFVIACNCLACQKRTGAVFGTGAYYPLAVIRVEGTSKSFQRTADSGRGLTNHFCPECGTNVYWTLEMRPDHAGVAIGCFADPAFTSAQCPCDLDLENKHHWVDIPGGYAGFRSGCASDS